MPQNQRRHKNDTKLFDELTYAGQAKAVNIKAVWFLDATRSHIRKCVEVHGAARAQAVPKKIAGQLRRMAEQVERIT
jgi:hypothetical protein